MMQMFPDLAALDKDEDGEISSEELQNAPAALKTLDKDANGELTAEEMSPNIGRGGRRGRGGRGGRGFFGGGGSGVERLDPEEVDFKDGVSNIPDRETFKKLSYQGPDVMVDTYLAGLEFVKFQIERAGTEAAQIYFMNTKTHRGHPMFMQAIGLPMGERGQMRGVLIYRPIPNAPNGEPGLYTFEFEPNDAYPFDEIKIAHDLLVKYMPLLEGRLAYYPLPRALELYHREKAKYDASDVSVRLAEDLYSDIGYLPLNLSEAFGRLRLMNTNERPSSRDIVVYKTLPNEMPRVAGIITEVRQTPLSHVNLRAIQDDAPNAFITNATSTEEIAPLIGKYVFFKVAKDGYEIREASLAEVEAHFAALRPATPQVPQRDLSTRKVLPLDDIKFGDSSAFGVKASNLATLRTMGLPDGVVPSGFGVPFYFYDEFMKHNGFYRYASQMLEDSTFGTDQSRRAAELERFQKAIKKGKMPAWMNNALTDLQESFPAGTSIRCRSSTNNEDLPGFSGAGLYDSYTHHPDEGHLSKTVKQVFASLWNLRAYEEREFHRIDHLATAMGVLVHPNFEGEAANGVAVTDDILYQTQGNYYLNTQVGEDMVTNPGSQSIPEEILLDWWDSSTYKVMGRSNRIANDAQVLSDESLKLMRVYLGKIHLGFSRLYGVSLNQENWSMEVEFKITKDGVLSIKQARPWVY